MKCHHHEPLAVPLHLAFGTSLFPPCTNPNPCPFCEAVFQPFSCSPLSHTLLAAVVPRAGSRLPWPSGGHLRETNVSWIFHSRKWWNLACVQKSCLCSEPWLTLTFLWGDKMTTFGLMAADLGQNYRSKTTTQESILAPNPAGILGSLAHFPG